ncbi:ATP-binding protein [Streptomyces sp. NPDC002790]|uniref:ATP-binding protein n=1 Tax=Streptomyces sp. NPDC002790 TaxID=3154431 RepID=UPI00332EAF25
MTQEAAELPRITHHFNVQLSPTPRGARLARLLVTEQLRSWDLPLDLDAAAHIVAELATNATTHGRVPGRDFRVALYVTEFTLRTEITDTRADLLPAVSDSGRGLLLVQALSDRWGVATGPAPRKTVWAEIRLRG